MKSNHWKLWLALLPIVGSLAAFGGSTNIVGATAERVYSGTDGIAEMTPEDSFAGVALWMTFSFQETNNYPAIIGNTMSATNALNPTFSTNYGGGLIFDAVTDELYMAVSDFMGGSTAQTIVAWIDVTNTLQRIHATCDEATANFAHVFQITSARQLQTANVSNNAATGAAVLSNGVNFVGWQWTGSSNNFFVNGLRVNSTNTSGAQPRGINSIGNRDNRTFGTLHRNTTLANDLRLYEVLIFSNALTELQVTNMWNAQRVRYGK